MYDKIIEIVEDAKSYNALHTNLRLIYDMLEFTDETLKLKQLLIGYCADIVMFARSGKMVEPCDNIESKQELINYCRLKSSKN